MFSHQKNKSGGFIKMILLIVVVLIILGYFGFNVEDIVKSPTVQKNLHYVWNFVSNFWDKYLVGTFSFIWNKIIIGIVWENIQKVTDR